MLMISYNQMRSPWCQDIHIYLLIHIGLFKKKNYWRVKKQNPTEGTWKLLPSGDRPMAKSLPSAPFFTQGVCEKSVSEEIGPFWLILNIQSAGTGNRPSDAMARTRGRQLTVLRRVGQESLSAAGSSVGPWLVVLVFSEELYGGA